jgi:cytochrome c6
MIKSIVGSAIILSLAVFFSSLSYAQTPGSSSYKAKCQMCHGASGLGDTPAGKAMSVTSFSDPKITAMSDAALLAVIKSGSGKMPAYQGKLTDDEVTFLLQYIHQLQAGH